MARKVNSQRTILFVNKKCFECGEEDHIVINCSNKKNDKNKKGKKEDDKKKKFIKRKKNGQGYFVEWDSDANFDDDDDDDDKPSKGVARIAIKEAPSLFSTPHCLMTKDGDNVL